MEPRRFTGRGAGSDDGGNALISQSTEYALRAALHIAEHSDNGPVRVQDVARDLDVPRNYLSKILHQLGRSNVVTSTRGPNGGFRLAAPPATIPLARIVEPFEPNLVDGRRRCLLGREVCSDTDPCGAHHHWKRVAAEILDFFHSKTLADLLAAPGDPLSRMA